jgi:hypothetical protein
MCIKNHSPRQCGPSIVNQFVLTHMRRKPKHYRTCFSSFRPFYKAGFAPIGCPGVGVPGAINYTQISLSSNDPHHRSKHTSFCALCAIISARSCSTIICSSLYASAHGTPNSSALVLTTHSVLPPMNNPDLSHEVVVLTFEETLRRVEAGIMSCSARMRS